MKTQDITSFQLPLGFRGRSALTVQIWWLVQSVLFRGSPQVAYGFRRWLLRMFGAKIGRGVLIRPSVTVTYPWKLSIGDNCWVGDDVVLYTLGRVAIGDDVVISQRSYICAADHDYRLPDFPIRERGILIESEVWVAADAFIGPGVNIRRAAVIGARSSVFSEMPAEMLCVGHPCRPVRPRVRSYSGRSESDAPASA